MRRGREIGRRRPGAGRPGWVLATILCAVAVLSAVAAAPASAQRFTYEVSTQGEVASDRDEFARIARETLNDIRGWSLNYNADYLPVASGGDFRLIIASPQAVDRAARYCSARWSCRVGDRVLINDRRWRNTTPTWPLSRRAYRAYAINHEVGHWLGLGHENCSAKGEPAPVMQQQSKDLQGCEANPWPLPDERARLGE